MRRGVDSFPDRKRPFIKTAIKKFKQAETLANDSISEAGEGAYRPLLPHALPHRSLPPQLSPLGSLDAVTTTQAAIRMLG